MQGERTDDRVVIGITGAEALSFLQGLVTNDVLAAGQGAGDRLDGPAERRRASIWRISSW